MASQKYSIELQLNKANFSDTGALFLDSDLSITNGIVSSKRASCIKGQIWSPLEQKLKVAFHQFHPIGLLEK